MKEDFEDANTLNLSEDQVNEIHARVKRTVEAHDASAAAAGDLSSIIKAAEEYSEYAAKGGTQEGFMKAAFNERGEYIGLPSPQPQPYISLGQRIKSWLKLDR
jgi:hypothetical protein